VDILSPSDFTRCWFWWYYQRTRSEIWGFHAGDCFDCGLLVCSTRFGVRRCLHLPGRKSERSCVYLWNRDMHLQKYTVSLPRIL